VGGGGSSDITVGSEEGTVVTNVETGEAPRKGRATDPGGTETDTTAGAGEKGFERSHSHSGISTDEWDERPPFQ